MDQQLSGQSQQSTPRQQTAENTQQNQLVFADPRYQQQYTGQPSVGQGQPSVGQGQSSVGLGQGQSNQQSLSRDNRQAQLYSLVTLSNRHLDRGNGLKRLSNNRAIQPNKFSNSHSSSDPASSNPINSKMASLSQQQASTELQPQSTFQSGQSNQQLQPSTGQSTQQQPVANQQGTAGQAYQQPSSGQQQSTQTQQNVNGQSPQSGQTPQGTGQQQQAMQAGQSATQQQSGQPLQQQQSGQPQQTSQKQGGTLKGKKSKKTSTDTDSTTRTPSARKQRTKGKKGKKSHRRQLEKQEEETAVPLINCLGRTRKTRTSRKKERQTRPKKRKRSQDSWKSCLEAGKRTIKAIQRKMILKTAKPPQIVTRRHQRAATIPSKTKRPRLTLWRLFKEIRQEGLPIKR